MITEDYFEFNIIKSKRINRRNPFFILFAILFIPSILIIFTHRLIGIDNSSIPMAVNYFAGLITLGGLGLFIFEAFAQPEKIGTVGFYVDKIVINTETGLLNIPINSIHMMEIEYYGYKNPPSNLRGNNNFIHIINDSDNYKFEIELRSKKEKTILKNIFNNLKSKGVNISKKEKTLNAF